MWVDEAKQLASVGYWSQEIGIRALELRELSGVSVEEFCARTGISRNRLQYWRSRAGAAPAMADSVAKVSFREVAVVANRGGGTEPAWLAELSLPGAWRVRVARDFDGPALGRLLRLLESGC